MYKLLVLALLAGGCLWRGSPARAWSQHRRGSATELPRSSGGALQSARSEEISLQKKSGAPWEISGGVLDFYQFNTPRQTLEAFLLAIENKRFEIMYQLMPSDDKAAIPREEFIQNASENFAELLAAAIRLRAHMNEPIRITGDTALLFYPSGGAELVFELDHWCVVAIY